MLDWEAKLFNEILPDFQGFILKWFTQYRFQSLAPFFFNFMYYKMLVFSFLSVEALATMQEHFSIHGQENSTDADFEVYVCSGVSRIIEIPGHPCTKLV